MNSDVNGPSSVGILVSDKKRAEESGQTGNTELGAFDALAYRNLGFQMQVRLFYDSNKVQYFFTGLILLNFIIILIQATTWAMTNSDVSDLLSELDRVFVYIFLVELIINMYGNWFWHFWQVSRWNWFDFIVITLSLLSPVMSAIRVARVVRLLRVLRVAGKLESLRTIIATFDRSMGAVGAVVCLLLMLMCIYAVFGVHDYKTNDPENFGDLGKAMFTMFQLVTIEGWPDIARNLMKQVPSAPYFFVSFMIIAALTTIEVVAAIFLDKMAEAKDYVKEEQALHIQAEKDMQKIVEDRVAIIGKFNAGEITGVELQDGLDALSARERKIEERKLSKDDVRDKVDKSKTMRMSMDLADAFKASINMDQLDTNGDGVLSQSEMDVGVIDMLNKISGQMQELNQRMERIESATPGAKRGKGLING